MDWATATGVLAELCATASYSPQLKKCSETGETGDLSVAMFLTLFAGLALWVAYGIRRNDGTIMVANSISLCFLTGILFFYIAT